MRHGLVTWFAIFIFSLNVFANDCLQSLTVDTSDADQVYEAHGIKTEYPDKVKNQAKKLLKRGIKPRDLEGRKDYRNEHFITIDGHEPGSADVTDKDDAINVTKLENGNYLLRVAVPDIAHFVSPKSDIGQWYFEQATSHYLREKVFHLLPLDLVSGLLSIDPDQERLAVVYEVEFNPIQSKFFNFKVEEAILKSKKAYSYDEFQVKIDNKEERSEEENLIIELYNEINSSKDPSISFPFITEKRPTYDENGKINGFTPLKTNVSNHLIEVLMVTANSQGARFMEAHGIPGIFRGQEEPMGRKLKVFYETLGKMGIHVKVDRELSILENLQNAFDKMKKYKHPEVVLPLLFYVTNKAENAAFPGKHFYLNVDPYSFLTSPLRRVSDYWNQYYIKHFLKGTLHSQESLELLEKQSVIIENDNEIIDLAKQSENNWVSRKQLRLLGDKIKGKSYKAIYIREFAKNSMVFIPELEMYAFVDKWQEDIPKTPFDKIGKQIDVKILDVDLESAELKAGFY